MRVWILLSLLLVPACKNKVTSSTGDYEKATRAVSKVVKNSQRSKRVAVTLVTPEQASNTIYQALGFRLWEGSDIDPIVELFGVALGGVDFQSTFERDRNPRVHTLLVTRSIAWTAAIIAVFNDSDRDIADRQVFNIADLSTDWPDVAGGAGQRWEDQLADLYWRLLARAPTADEIAAHKAAFTAISTDNGHAEWGGFGWIGILYALLSTQEFWNL